jgi:nitroreductase
MKMRFLDIVKTRRSVRNYESTAVEDKKLEYILEAVRLAPTAANRQPFKLIVVHTEGKQALLSEIYERKWFVQAPIIICACGIPDDGWVRGDGKNYTTVDVAIIVDHLTLAATELGLGTCWIANFNENAARNVLQIPEDVMPIVFITLGYPADQEKSKTRKPLSELICYEHW